MFGYLLVTSFIELRDAQRTEQVLTAEIEGLGGEPQDVTSRGLEKTIEESGYSAQRLEADQRIAKDFFNPISTATSSKSYEKAYEYYVDFLGEGNSFVQTYFIRSSSDSGNKLNEPHIIESIDLIPLHANRNTVHYAAFITSYPASQDSDPVEKGIVKFTISGEVDERKITDVEMWE